MCPVRPTTHSHVKVVITRAREDPSFICIHEHRTLIDLFFRRPCNYVYVLQVHHQQQEDNQYKKPYKNHSQRLIARQLLQQTTEAIFEASKVRSSRPFFAVALCELKLGSARL